jgi:inosine-uridine nucleoside N-ribohydrolase
LFAKHRYIPEGGNFFYIHGENAIEGQYKNIKFVQAPSTEAYTRLASSEKRIEIISLAAITEVVKLLQFQNIKHRIESITLMGGVLFTQGNVDTNIETNLAHDPKALDILLEITEKEKIPLTIVPLDITENPQLELTTERVQDIADKLKSNGSPNIAEMLLKLAGPKATYPNFYRQKRGVISHNSPFTERKFKGSPIHDLTAVFAKVHPELFETINIPIVQRYPGVLGAPTSWMNRPDWKCNIVMNIKYSNKYWNYMVEYLLRYK